MERVFHRVPAARIYEETGIQFMPINTLYQLIALENSPAFASADRLVLIPDLLAYWLTGEVLTEATNASTTQLLDVRSGGWAYSLIDELKLPRRLFASIVEPGAVISPLRPAVIDEVGLKTAGRRLVRRRLAAAPAHRGRRGWNRRRSP